MEELLSNDGCQREHAPGVEEFAVQFEAARQVIPNSPFGVGEPARSLNRQQRSIRGASPEPLFRWFAELS
jgi:hypothetical protein